jgi:arylsulfatase A-like enzyme
MLAFVPSLVAEQSAQQTPKKPNIILLLIDDWAWNGTSVRMDDAKPNSAMPVASMPHLERMAREGVKFRNAYAGAPQCGPSRVCIQTGKSTARSGFTVTLGLQKEPYYDTRGENAKMPVIPNTSDVTIDPDAITIPEALKALGYASAHIGKWHMGGDPGNEGYDVHDGHTDNKEGNQRIPDDPKLMFSMTERAITFMKDQTKNNKPFYLQLSHYAMHEGRECLEATRKKYQEHPAVQAYYQQTGKAVDKINQKSDPAVWLGMAEDLDGRIGAVLKALDDLHIADNTYVVMVSDNGYRHSFLPGLTQPLHAAKWWVWQGGIRVPMIIKGPGIAAGTVFNDNVIHYDLLPTFVAWAGGDPATLTDIDGINLAPYLRGQQPDQSFTNRYLYFHYPHYRTSMPHSAIVSATKKVMHFYERPDLPLFFDLKQDEGEMINRAPEHQREQQALFAEMMRYFKQVDARIPKLNPEADEAVYKQAKEYGIRQKWGPFTGTRSREEDE